MAPLIRPGQTENAQAIYRGENEVQAVYRGNNLVWQRGVILGATFNASATPFYRLEIGPSSVVPTALATEFPAGQSTLEVRGGMAKIDASRFYFTGHPGAGNIRLFRGTIAGNSVTIEAGNSAPSLSALTIIDGLLYGMLTNGSVELITVNWPNLMRSFLMRTGRAPLGNAGGAARLGDSYYVLTTETGTLRIYELTISGNSYSYALAATLSVAALWHVSAAVGVDDAIYAFDDGDGQSVYRITGLGSTPAIATFGTLTPGVGGAVVL